ncbi:Spindle assembly abnormal protein 6 [Perkinsus chesapeaki]|uniref:Spindle assembly abnormal protein 6 n=1 Tax=Perkinsus chesapeaki TaxID=330153 RepID=A0A7J6LYQ0_PERCH|nr:Spindle assembly abnormal protein 6 [Perkinsus chesapeaki]
MSGGPSGGSTAVHSSENEHILYARDVKVRIRPVDREEYSTNLTLKLSIQTAASRGNGGSSGGNATARAGASGALLIMITDSKDPFFLYEGGVINGALVNEHKRLLVDFQNFPKMITELVAECAHSATSGGPSSGGQNMSVYLAVGESTVESTMSIIEANQFREITHLCLRMRKGTDEVIKHYLASKLNHYQHMAERLEETLCNTEKELRRVAAERQSQAEEISLMKAERCQLEQSLKAGYEREIAEVSERHAREIRDNHNKLTAERETIVKDLTTQLDGANEASKTAAKSLTEAQEKIATLETSLGSSKRKLEAALKERDEDKERYGSSSAEVKRLEKENFTLEKKLSELGVSLAMCKEQLATKEELASKSRELLEQANQQKASLEEQIQMYRTSLTQLEEKLSVSFKETTKGNEVIKKLQEQIKAYKSRVKGLKQSMQTHEETIHELDRRLLDEQRAHDDTKLEHKRALDALDRAHEDCDATRGKLAEAHKLLESNEQVISYLNKRLTDRDVKVLSGIEPGSSSSGGYSALSLPVLPSHRHHQQPQAITSSSTSHHTTAGSSSRSHSPSTSRLGGSGVLSNRTNTFEGGGGGGGAMQISGSASTSMIRQHAPPPYHSGQRLASGFTIPGGSATAAKRSNFDDISAIGHHLSGVENQPPPPSSSSTSAAALQNRLAAGPVRFLPKS